LSDSETQHSIFWLVGFRDGNPTYDGNYKLVKWIKKEWEKNGYFYIGNEAKSLITEGAERVNFLPS